MKKLFSVLLITFSFFVTQNLQAQDAQKAKNKKAKSTDVPTSYEPNAAHPYGRLNPKAPPETKQFSFMIGEFDCVDEIVNPQTGKWFKMKAIWNAKYFLNGHAIQDQYWSPAFSTSNIRIFDVKDKKWKVTFFRMPGYSPSNAISGQKEGKNMVMRQGTEKQGSKLTFYNITKNGFDWVGESMQGGKANPFWKSSCKRRR